MLKNICKLALPLVAACGIFVAAIFTPVSAAGANTVWLEPGSGAYTAGGQFTVTVKGNANGITGGELRSNIVLKYPNNLSVVTFKNGGMARSNTIHTASSRTLTFTHSDILFLPAVNNATLFTVTFKADGAGAAPVTFTDGLFRGRRVATVNATYSINNPACPAGQIGTWPNCSTPPPPPSPPSPPPSNHNPGGGGSGSSNPNPGGGGSSNLSPPPVVIDADPIIKTFSTKANYDTVNFAWSTDVATTATIKYGSANDKLDQSAQTTPASNSLDFTGKINKLAAGKTYYYELVVKKSTGKTTSRKGSVTTKKYPVVLTSTKDDLPFDRASIVFDDEKAVDKSIKLVTNASGEVALSLLPGTYAITVSKDDFTKSLEFTVEEPSFPEGGTPNTQMITLNLDDEKDETTTSNTDSDKNDEPATVEAESDSGMNIVAMIVGGVFALLAIVGVIIVVIKKRQQNQDTANGGWHPLVEHDFNDLPPADATYPGTQNAPQDYSAYQNPLYPAPDAMQVNQEGYYPTDPSIDPLADDPEDAMTWNNPYTAAPNYGTAPTATGTQTAPTATPDAYPAFPEASINSSTADYTPQPPYLEPVPYSAPPEAYTTPSVEQQYDYSAQDSYLPTQGSTLDDANNAPIPTYPSAAQAPEPITPQITEPVDAGDDVFKIQH